MRVEARFGRRDGAARVACGIGVAVIRPHVVHLMPHPQGGLSMPSQTRWLDILRQGDDATPGALVVRLARLAERAHTEAAGDDTGLLNARRKEGGRLDGTGLPAVTPRQGADGRPGAIRTEAER